MIKFFIFFVFLLKLCFYSNYLYAEILFNDDNLKNGDVVFSDEKNKNKENNRNNSNLVTNNKINNNRIKNRNKDIISDNEIFQLYRQNNKENFDDLEHKKIMEEIKTFNNYDGLKLFNIDEINNIEKIQKEIPINKSYKRLYYYLTFVFFSFLILFLFKHFLLKKINWKKSGT